MNKTPIEWTDFTWNPIRARLRGASKKARSGTFCTKISPGCANCYASSINRRFGTGMAYTVPNLAEHEFFIDDRILAEPLKLRKPSRIFVGDMFDLFHESIQQEFIAEVLRVALKTPRHTFQFLTKRAEQMKRLVTAAQTHWGVNFGGHMWFGVSIEDQPRADERIPLLLQTPVAVRFLSVEPMLEAIEMQPESIDGMPTVNALTGADWCDPPIPGLDWVICGGESGPGARPFNLAWANALRKQCCDANVPFFMKQIGSNPIDPRPQTGLDDGPLLHNDHKGGDPAEWPEALRVRQFPTPKELALGNV